jgi:iron complex outermembrane receptor protein
MILASLVTLPALTAHAEEASSGLETVIVTAQKREENLQVVPVAVTAFGRQALADIRFEDVKDLSAVAPGLTVRDSAGGNQQANLTMRGVYATNTFASEPGVAMYIDGVYLQSAVGAEFDLADVDRVEVLRGPQGTLFGRNAIGGAVNVITREPTGQFAGRQEFSFGNFNQFRSKTSVDFPAWGALSAQITYLHDERDGDVRNLGAGTVWHFGPATGGKYGDLVSPKTLGGHDTNAVGAALKLEPGSGIKAVYRFNYSHKEFVPDATGIATFDAGLPSVSGLFQPFWAAQDPSTRTPISSTRPDAVNNWFTTPGVLKIQNHSLTISAPINDSISIKNLLAYRRIDDAVTNQLDGLGGILLAPGSPVLPLVNDTQSAQRSFQEELQANIETKWVKSTVGYMHFHSHTREGGYDNLPISPFGSGLFPGAPGLTNFTPTPTPGVLNDDVTLTTDAVYTQEEIHVVPKLDLVLGGRYTWDRRGGFDNSPTPNAPGTPLVYSKGTPTYIVGLNYQLSDDIFTYAKLSSGYIAGGRIANVQFNPSTAKSWEAGVKSDLLDHRLRLNLAAYTVKYTGIQVFTSPMVGCANVPGVVLSAPQCIVNGGNARAKGFEAEATLVPTSGLTLAGNVAYTDIYYTSITPDLRASDGTFVSTYTPAWTAALSAQYTGPDLASLGDAHVIARAEANYSSSAYGQPNSLLSVENATKIPSRWLLNARVGLAGFRVGGTEIEVAGYAKNLTNNKSVIYNFNAAINIPVNYQTARTYGVDMNIGF